jgi:hypothetical protein
MESDNIDLTQKFKKQSELLSKRESELDDLLSENNEMAT